VLRGPRLHEPGSDLADLPETPPPPSPPRGSPRGRTRAKQRGE